MNTTPKGKIGRLPKTLRDEVNRRLENGQKGPVLVAWLNGLPEVQTMKQVAKSWKNCSA